MTTLNQLVNSTSINNTIFIPEATLKSTSFVTTFVINETEYLPMWNVIVDYEIYGWNVLFVSICSIILFCCFCSLILHFSYKYGESYGELEQYKTEHSLKQLHHSTIPIYKTSDSFENSAELIRIYRFDISYPFYYYIIQWFYFISILIEYILIIYYSQFGIESIFILFYNYLFFNILFSIYIFCDIFLLLIQTIIFLFLCNFQRFGLIIYISIFIFQITVQFMIGIIKNDLFDFKQLKSDFWDRNLKLFLKYCIENIRFAIIFFNFELFPLFYYKIIRINQTQNYWYLFSLIFIIWLSILFTKYIKYMLRFGQFFNPKKHSNHFLISLYFRIYIISSIVFKFINICLCAQIILYTNYNGSNYSENYFQFYYCIFIIIYQFIQILIIPCSLSLYKRCCCTKWKTCLRWFVCCKEEI